ncbi:mitochondrial carrier superfamily protein [Cardiosporidium cionae]|uniref:Mitochondrial carrier superfamily protein n=1 Tax=Cardiosporidium cionae TaxID=476202 RepID=A0ABQ7J6B9_9APIC|nr:mitochondrial carrier superfamily protein [Cardiosporidium cionae]|eukprot:KAF8819545.1 mitochondrial carrier superfamily protein [Cardiosporidium cionae]
MDHAGDFFAGGCAGVTVDAVLFPLDAIKTRMQARATNVTSTRSLYAGINSTMLGSFPSAAAFFCSYEAAKVHLSQNYSHQLSLPCIHVASASIAELCACAIRVPFEVVKQQMQVGLHATLRDTTRAIYAQQGLRGFFIGYGSTVAREIPFDGLEFALWEQFKALYAENSNSPPSLLSPFVSACCGSIAGGIAAAVTTPLDVAKTRLMTQGNNLEYSGLWDCLASIWKHEGPSKLFLGIGPRVCWISLGGFVFFGSFETYKHFLLKSKAK